MRGSTICNAVCIMPLAGATQVTRMAGWEAAFICAGGMSVHLWAIISSLEDYPSLKTSVVLNFLTFVKISRCDNLL